MTTRTHAGPTPHCRLFALSGQRSVALGLQMIQQRPGLRRKIDPGFIHASGGKLTEVDYL
jgi:hypothetical protein